MIEEERFLLDHVTVPIGTWRGDMLQKVQIFSADQAAELKRLEDVQKSLQIRAQEIEGGSRSAGLKGVAQEKVSQYARAIQQIEFGQNPENRNYYIQDDAKRAEALASKDSIVAERDQAQAELDALTSEYKQIEVKFIQLKTEMAPFVVLQGFQQKLDESWPMIMVGESTLKTVTEIAPDLIVAVIAQLMDAFLDCREKLQPQLQRNREMDAKAIRADFQAFLAAGFNGEDAMQLTLARVKASTLTSLMQIAGSMKK